MKPTPQLRLIQGAQPPKQSPKPRALTRRQRMFLDMVQHRLADLEQAYSALCLELNEPTN